MQKSNDNFRYDNSTLQLIMYSFKNFEKKLEKLQSDIDSHGCALTDLRKIVTNISMDKMPIKTHIKSTAIQSDSHNILKFRKKDALRPFNNKLKSRSFQSDGFTKKILASDLNWEEPNRKELISGKAFTKRKAKADNPRKTTTLRPPKAIDRKKEVLNITLM